MRPIVSSLITAIVAISLIMLWNEHNNGSVAAAQQRATPTLTRIYTGPDQQTHAQQVNLKLTLNPLYGREESPRVKVTSSYVVRFLRGYVQDWHPATARRYVITLSGRGEIELAGGQKIPLPIGALLQADDDTGKGHITRTLGNEDWVALFVEVDK